MLLLCISAVVYYNTGTLQIISTLVGEALSSHYRRSGSGLRGQELPSNLRLVVAP
jgi:hypothetical protein